MLAPRYHRTADSLSDLFVIVWAFAFDASLCGEASVSLDDLALWNTGSPLECVNVLCEARVQKTVRMQHLDE